MSNLTREFGSRSVFAIESQITSFYKPGYPMGHFSIWIGGRQIGDSRGIEPLGAIAVSLDHIVRRGWFANEQLANMPKQQILASLVSRVFDPELEAESPVQFDPSENLRDYFLAPGLSESTDGYYVVILPFRTRSRILWLSMNEPHLDTAGDVVVSNRDYVDPMSHFSAWIASSASE